MADLSPLSFDAIREVLARSSSSRLDALSRAAGPSVGVLYQPHGEPVFVPVAPLGEALARPVWTSAGVDAIAAIVGEL